MSIYIKGLERPKDNGCYLLTVRYDADGEMCVYPLEKLGGYDSRDTKHDTPMYRVIEVPDHGRLIDADALEELCVKLNAEEWRITRADYKMLDNVIFEFPTIIPADRG